MIHPFSDAEILSSGLSFITLNFDLSYMETLPEELTCEIVSRVQDPRDIQRLRRTNQLFNRLAPACIRRLEYPPDDTLAEPVSLDLVLTLPNLEVIKPFVQITEPADLFDLARMAHLRHVAVDLFDLLRKNAYLHQFNSSGNSKLSRALQFTFLNAYATRRDPLTGQRRKRSFAGTRILLRDDTSTDLILGGLDGRTVGILNGDQPADVVLMDPWILGEIQERFLEPSTLIMDVVMAEDAGDIDHFAPVVNWTLTTNVYSRRQPDFLPDVAYLNTERVLRSVRLLMPEGDTEAGYFDKGYKFNPDQLNREYFPAENPIALDIPFIVNPALISLILEFFPKVTLLGLFVRDLSKQEVDLRFILDMLTLHSILVNVYTRQPLSDYTNPLVTFVPPLAIEPYDLI
jgi:hypothetical protein